MSKNEFLDKLSEELKKRLGATAANELLADFREHFDEALKEGKSEDEVCGMLGDPADIASEYFEDMDGDAAPPDAGIYISLTHISLECEPWDKQTFSVEILRNNKEVDDETIQIYQENNSLRVVQARDSFINLLFHMFRFRETVRVMIPRRYQGDMAVKMASGSARINGITLTGGVTCNVTSGAIHMHKVSAGTSLAVSTRSGGIHLDSCAGELSADCSSGTIKVKSHSGNVVRAAATSGSVRVEAGRITKDCTIECKSGGVYAQFDALEADLNMTCRSGSVKFQIHDLKGNVTGKTSSGSVVGMLPRDTRAVFLLQSAGVQNKFPNAVMPDSSVPVVNLTSRSGRVSVKEI